MEKSNTEKRQIDLLRDHLKAGKKINRVNAFRLYGIADLRSRISEIYTTFGMYPKRSTVKGKKYLEYYL